MNAAEPVPRRLPPRTFNRAGIASNRDLESHIQNMRTLNAAAVLQRRCRADTKTLQVVLKTAARARDVLDVLGPNIVVNGGRSSVFGRVEGPVFHLAADGRDGGHGGEESGGDGGFPGYLLVLGSKRLRFPSNKRPMAAMPSRLQTTGVVVPKNTFVANVDTSLPIGGCRFGTKSRNG
ncbi:hypothetical protein IQ06DRAFT_305835 [Phaeosphaeriaceae sp. SRC1lsM3a]|nr:hypothetical protein IQ06DRAFT_305835 [Stagonospora sp. SRC1lsM3a]